MAECDENCCQGQFDVPEGSPCGMTTTVLGSCLPLPLPQEILDEVVPKAKDFAILNGAGMRSKTSYDPDSLGMAPFLLLPSSFPRREFQRVVSLQPLLNLLVHRVAHDHQFLHRALRKTIEVDGFTRRLWEIYESVRKEGIAQDLILGLVRSDVMLTRCLAGCCDLCRTPPYVTGHQVEVNTIASGFGHMGPVSGRIHRYVLAEMRKSELLKNLPENDALAGLCNGMIAAWDYYGNPKSVILFVVEDVSYNICDQRFHEYEIRQRRPDVHVIRKTLTQLASQATLSHHKALLVNGEEVGVVYFRSGYKPSQYPGEAEWAARLTIERSMAIKCPSIHYQLAGTKKVQQEVSSPEVLKKFLSSSEADLVAQLFTGLYSLDRGPEGDMALNLALNDPERFVLKPQREGGGNNVYGKEIREVLERLQDSPEREAYILMDKIRPPVQENYLVRPHKEVTLAEVVSELGIFGVIIGTKDEILVNNYAGHMLRTKLSSVDEGGVAAGLGALDSVFLFD